MKREVDLDAAVKGVESHVFGAELSVNSVLAAHLRAVGVPPTGTAWKAAKAVLARTGDFRLAAREGLRLSREGGAAADRVTNSSVEHAAHSPRGTAMVWFPKQFGPGDLDGLGARRLLGTPHLEPAWVLVRETGQNSWDARGGSKEIEFVLNLRRLSQAEISTLSTEVFTGPATGTGIRGLVRKPALWALEVSDRGTVGLGGPIRNDLTVPAGVATDFIDLVFNIGAPRDVHLGAGTYGFGKTISYAVSSVGAIVLWSRPATDLEGERLIASAIGDSFDADGRRYTGRHWWGRSVGEEDRVEPLVGPPARELAKRVFSSSFEGPQSGTSILIIDPRLGGETREEDAARLVDAAVWNLWPKLIEGDASRSRMKVRVQMNGNDLPLPDIEDHPILAGHAACLHAVRAVQGDRPPERPARFPVEVHEVRSQLPPKLIGHLALARYPRGRAEVGPLGTSSRHVALMRHEAELVVRYLERQPLEGVGFQWAGVFKPVADVDDAFAQAEPPAHDDWVPASVEDKRQRRDVNVGLREIRAAADRFVRPTNAESAGDGDMQSAAVVGDLLADLLGGIEGPAPTMRKTTSSSGGKRAPRPKVDIVWSDQEVRADGWTVTSMDVRLAEAGPGGANVVVRARVGFDGGSEDDPRALRPRGWVDEYNGYDSGPVHLSRGQVRRFVVESRPDVAVDVETLALDD